jgi:selenocysteine lyase/cysteine desulfurase
VFSAACLRDLGDQLALSPRTRVSPHFYLAAEEVDALLAAPDELALDQRQLDPLARGRNGR